MLENFAESDEAFARRLQAQEMGNFVQRANVNADAQTPLMNRVAENPTVINARLSEVNTSRATLYAIFLVNTPQVLATIIVLSMHWMDPDVCDLSHTLRWKWWAIFSAVRMIAYSGIVLFIDLFRPWLQERRDASDRVKSLRNTIDAFGLIWFVVGNMWLFGDDDDNCAHPERSPIYNLCVAMLVINYVQICLPCIIAIILIPVFCFCMPCLIRLLARLQDPRAATAGASEAVIETLPEVVIDGSHLQAGADNTCPICLNEMNIGESARLLRCQHIFHKQCVDEWLRVNASCPTCRKRIFGSNGDSDEAGNRNATHATGATGAADGGAVPVTVTAPVGTAGTAAVGSGAESGSGDSSSNASNSSRGGGDPVAVNNDRSADTTGPHDTITAELTLSPFSFPQSRVITSNSSNSSNSSSNNSGNNSGNSSSNGGSSTAGSIFSSFLRPVTRNSPLPGTAVTTSSSSTTAATAPTSSSSSSHSEGSRDVEMGEMGTAADDPSMALLGSSHGQSHTRFESSAAAGAGGVDAPPRNNNNGNNSSSSRSGSGSGSGVPGSRTGRGV